MDDSQSMKYQVCPDLTPIEFEALKGDIAKHGIYVPVEQDENGEILDGHHRLRAWRELNAEGITLPDVPVIVRYGMTEEQKRNHARRLNLYRRQMSPEERQRQMVEMRQDGASYRQIAQATGVDAKTAWNVVNKSGVEISTPAHVNGSDGKQYPATKSNGHVLDAPTLDYEAEAESLEEDEDGYDWTEPEPEPEPSAPKPVVRFVGYSSETPEHYTPRTIIDAVLQVFGTIDLDPCSNSEDAPNVPATTHYTADDDGLAQYWQGKVYMNPPYGRQIGDWITKLCESYETGDVTEAIALVPGRIDTAWWRRLNESHPFLCFVSGRLTFIGNGDAAPFPSVVAYLGSNCGDFYDAFVPHGDLYQRLNREMFGA